MLRRLLAGATLVPVSPQRRGRRAVHEAMRHGHAATVRCIEEGVCPFRAHVVRRQSGFFGLFASETPLWLVVHRARPHDNRAVDRRANRVIMYSNKAAASAYLEMENAIVASESAGASAGVTRVQLKNASVDVTLDMLTHVADWLRIVLSPAFGRGTGPAFDEHGALVLPSFVTRENVHFVDAAASGPPAPAGGASSPAGASSAASPLPGGAPRPRAVAPPASTSGFTRVMMPDEQPSHDAQDSGASAVPPPSAPDHAPAAPFGAAPAPAMAYPSYLDHASEGPAPPVPPPPTDYASAAAVPRAESPAPMDDSDAPNELLCPITLELMRDPVIAADGHTYEREAITAWLEARETSPKTGEDLPDKRLIPNHVLRGQVIAWTEARSSSKAAAAGEDDGSPGEAIAVPPPAM